MGPTTGVMASAILEWILGYLASPKDVIIDSGVNRATPDNAKRCYKPPGFLRKCSGTKPIREENEGCNSCLEGHIRNCKRKAQSFG